MEYGILTDTFYNGMFLFMFHLTKEYCMIINGKYVDPNEFRDAAVEFYGFKPMEYPISVLIAKVESSLFTLENHCNGIESFCDRFDVDIEKARRLFNLISKEGE
jgi:hypothetical protein